MKNKIGQFVINLFVILIFSGLGFSQTSYVVNSSDDMDDGVCDSGHCSLREAINAANTTAGKDTIKFDIQPYGTYHTIQPDTVLPGLIQPIVIKGYSQKNAKPAKANTPARIMIVLDGMGAINDGLRISSDGCIISGLAIKNFVSFGIEITGDSNIIVGNYIGTDVAGLLAEGNDFGVYVLGNNNIIGGSSFKARNVISGNASTGIGINSPNSYGNSIQGNYVGANADAADVLGNNIGISVSGYNNLIGGSNEGEGNLIWGNSHSGITLGSTANQNLIMGNLIGVDENGNNRGNLSKAVICDGNETQIGGIGEGEGNTIAYNGDDGITIDNGQYNPILGNSIYANEGLAIDLGNNGHTPNDVGDGDTMSNDLQNYPLLTLAEFDGTNLTVEGVLDSKPNTVYDLHFYSNSECDPSGYGEGEKFKVVENNVTSGTFSFTWYAPNINVNKLITATATDPYNNTSEFSNCQQIVMAAPKQFTGELQSSKPEAFALHQNYPNPFNPTTLLRFDVPERSDMSIRIYNVTGQLIRTLVERSFSAGQHNISWDGKNTAGQMVGSGTYFVKMVTGEFVQIRKITLLR